MASDKDDANGSGVVVAESKQAERREKVMDCCKKVFKVCFSHIGLCGMVIAYSIAGGFVFSHLEETNEKNECSVAEKAYGSVVNETKYNLWVISQTYKSEEQKGMAVEEYEKVLDGFRSKVTGLGYEGQNCSIMGEEGGPELKWSFAGALFFSVTVITTIGYGNIAPKTDWGRAVCIAYATLGIPLMLLCLANIGDAMADIFRFIYMKVCCCGCCRRKPEPRTSLVSSNSNQQAAMDAWKKDYQSSHITVTNDVEILEEVDEDEEDEDEFSKINVPITVTLSVITGYIFLGAVIFGNYEKWDELKSCYFCFITISTIGFGDVVPGFSNKNGGQNHAQMIISAIYMLLGMALLSMCFSLIQEEIVGKFKWIAEKVGIIKEDKLEEQEEEEGDESTLQRGRKSVRRSLHRRQPSQYGVGPPGPKGMAGAHQKDKQM